MHFSSPLLLTSFIALVSTAPILSTREQNGIAAQSAISQWLSDIIQVNTFLNTIQTSNLPSTLALAALPIAQNEPVQLSILAPLASSAAAKDAVAVLQSKFSGVPAGITNIINADDEAPINDNTFSINELRCNFVLPNIAILWREAASENGLGAPGFPPGPVVCPALDGQTGVYPLSL